MSAPNLKEIEWAIHELENQESSESRYSLLAALYTCRNELMGLSPQQYKPPVSAYSEASEPAKREIEAYGDSDFLRVVSRKDPVAAWRVMDEHMEVLRVVNPRAYDGVIRKLNKI